ncbi:glutamate--tRNA ligase [Candidatus Curtissbacteria bacterium RBG_13_35_7]|uniref:Glutamate--tRNA ligase n=1 Tax=Candidatus Curtissbacteria bacterium RBG_13_35_7 TaxID=1797705 RepID=A0A1F5G265_9BACT|nr:MAG: glutamate--tRNA ligase [Candidatus Curtissbacteria bacterium RBG_13_35_7]
MLKVITRYAPSPTGIPHVGNIRTALFNYLFAKNQNGKFILRIEDTDQKRSTLSHIDKIKDSLKLLGIKWEQDYQQSKRLDIYQMHLGILKKKGLVYEDEGAWRFKINTHQDQNIHWQDIVHGNVSFPVNIQEDFIIIKSDGFPTYHFASVVDDHLMQITHVLRGDEWISSTPKHLMLYSAFSWQHPLFCHLPAILGADKKKLSKREGAKSVFDYIDSGYLPQALVNFLTFLGWAPKGDKELFSLNELINEFSLERLNKNSPIFNINKLNWFNKKYIQQLKTNELAQKIKKHSKVFKNIDNKKLSMLIDLIRDRMITLNDFDKYASIFVTKGKQTPPTRQKIQNAKDAITSIQNWNLSSITENLNKWILNNNLESADFKNTLRLSVFADNTPPIYDSLAILTKEETINRIDDAFQNTK